MMSNRTQQDSGVKEWYTPPHILEAARAALRGIALDPASDPVGDRRVGAARIFTREDDGLSQPWVARSVWLNPPYGRRDMPGEKKRYNQQLWSAKWLAEYRAGRMRSGILLVNASPGDHWWTTLFQAPEVWACICNERLRFIDRRGKERRDPVAGNSLFYVGPFGDLFEVFFEEFGRVLAPCGMKS